MNKVSLRCQKDACAKFNFASQRMFLELKIFKVLLYIATIVPVVLTFIPAINKKESLSFLYTLISFGLTIITEVASSFMNNHKEKAILEHQLYESEITGSTFSKIEYDRESTNDLNELAIRKGLPKMRRIKEENYPISYVPDDITDDYSYLYLCRKSAATTRYILSRVNIVYTFILVMIICAFTGCMFIKTETREYLSLIIGFYPLVIPIIRNCASCKKCMKQCVKICADVDNFFADGDASIERLARFYYYAQNIEFEMLTMRPAIYAIFPKLFRRGIDVLQDGVTMRFKDAIKELKGRSSGLVAQPKGKGLITRVDLDEIEKRNKERKRLEAKKQEELKVLEKKLEEVKQGKLTITQTSLDKAPVKKTTRTTTAKKELPAPKPKAPAKTAATKTTTKVATTTKAPASAKATTVTKKSLDKTPAKTTKKAATAKK